MTSTKKPVSIRDLIVGSNAGRGSFLGGICVTHDCDEFLLTDHLAWALTARAPNPPVEKAKRRKIVMTATVPDGGRLLVLSARIASNTFGSVPPPWLDHVQVGGRRLHAKFGLLAFRGGEKGPPIIRSYVTSANLTTGGAFRNREVIYVEESQGRGGLTLARELRLALDDFRSALADEDTNKKAFDALVSALEMRWLPKPAEPSRTRIVHSLGVERGLLADALQSRTAKRATQVTVISPPFGRNDAAGAAHAIRRHAGKNATIDIITAKAGEGTAIFPAGIFEDATQTIRYSTVRPTDTVKGPGGDPQDRNRTLHAKVYTFRWTGGDADILIGSANFTESALVPRGRQNRELLIRLPVKHAAHDAFLERWREGNGVESAPKRPKAPAESTMEAVLPPPTVEAAFHCEEGQVGTSERWTGRLKLEFREPMPDRVEYNGVPLELVSEQPLILQITPRFLTVVSANGRETQVAISFHPPTGDPQFFQRTKPANLDAEERTFLDWLGRVQRHRVADETTTTRRRSAAGTRASSDDDKIAFPLQNGLAVLGRLVRDRPDHIRSLKPEVLGRIRAGVLDRTAEPERPAARRVLEAVLAGTASKSERRKFGNDPLLTELTNWISELDKGEE